MRSANGALRFTSIYATSSSFIHRKKPLFAPEAPRLTIKSLALCLTRASNLQMHDAFPHRCRDASGTTAPMSYRATRVPNHSFPSLDCTATLGAALVACASIARAPCDFAQLAQHSNAAAACTRGICRWSLVTLPPRHPLRKDPDAFAPGSSFFDLFPWRTGANDAVPDMIDRCRQGGGC